MKNAKRNLILSGIMFGLSALLLISTTLAYFSDRKAVQTTFMSGNVAIVLSEAAVKEDGNGNLVEDATLPRVMGAVQGTEHNYGHIYPGQTIHKDPTVRNIGTTNAWIAFKVIVTDGDGDIYNVLGYPADAGIDLRGLLSGGVFSESAVVGPWNGLESVRYNDRFAMTQIANRALGKYEFFIFFNQTLAPRHTIELFDTFSVPPFFSSEHMKELEGLTIRVEAYAVQTGELPDVFTAMTAAFPEQFPF